MWADLWVCFNLSATQQAVSVHPQAETPALPPTLSPSARSPSEVCGSGFSQPSPWAERVCKVVSWPRSSGAEALEPLES